MANIDPKIEESWKEVLKEEFNADYFIKLKEFLINEKTQGITIYPPSQQIFSAFNHTSFNKVKVVILGQDPYHGPGQAHGLCFSVPDNIIPPPSLVNIFKELNADLGIPISKKGNLTYWAEQGVLLLNAILTVRASQAGSHQNKGWEIYTDAIIKELSARKKGLIFLLWGNYAKAKEAIIDTSKHYVLKAAHPSPFSANNGFLGCKHFSKTNELLRKQGLQEIDWTIK